MHVTVCTCVCCEKKPAETECDEDRQKVIRRIGDGEEINGEERICGIEVVTLGLCCQSRDTQ